MNGDIRHWLDSLGLGQYAEVFTINDVDFRALPFLSDEDLKELGVSLGHRRVLLAAIADLRQQRAAKATTPEPERRHEGEAERRQLTVMFCDLAGSTHLSTRLDAEDYRDLIRAYQDASAGVVARFDGFVAKFMGDGVLVYFGWPRAHEDDPERAINAGLGVIDAVRQLGDGRGASLAVRVGIATGRVVVGDIVGQRAAQEATIAGEAPNLAARLQEIAAPNTVVIAEATYALAGSLFECTDLGAQKLKGFDSQVSAWRVDAPRAIDSRFEATRARTLTPFVGREEELEILERRWHRARAGEGQVVLISGEPGIGKSRIVSALEDRIGARSHIRLRFQCSPYHTNSALYPVISQIKRAAGIEPDDSPDDKLDKLEEIVALAGNATAKVVPLIAPLLSIPFEQRYPPMNVSPQRQKQLTLAALVDQLAGLAQQQPVLFHFEDAHWIDPSSRELIDMTVARTRELAALVIITFRPDFAPAWTGEQHVTLLALNRLDATICASLATQIGGATALPANVIDEIVMRTDGVPLFVEEMTKTVVEAGTAAGTSDAPVPLAIPTSIEDSLMARLDNLGQVKEVAQVAAVLGRTFSHDVLAAVAGLDEAALETALGRLVAAELVYPRAVAVGVAYEFKHVLIQEAAYQSMLKRRRRHHHSRVADVLKAQFPEIAEPELLAHHYTEAGRLEQAIDNWLEAGQRAMQRSAHVEAEGHLRKGLELLVDLPETTARHRREIALQNALGVCLMPTRGFGNPEVAAAFTRAAEICERIDDARGLFVALRGKGQYHMISGDMHIARDETRRILALAERMHEHDFLIEAHHLGWSTLCFTGDFHAAQRHAEEGIARYDRERDHHLTYVYSGHDPGMCCRAFGSLSLCQLGYPDQALALCGEGLALAESLAHPFTVVIALWAKGILHQLRREPDATHATGDRIISYCTEKGLPPMAPMGKVFRGDALARQGEFADGISQMREGIAELRSFGTVFSLPGLFPSLACAFAGCGNVSDGLATIEEGLAMARSTGDHFSLPEILRVKAALLLASASAERTLAEATFLKAVEVARGQHARLLELRATMGMARLWGENGERSAARDLLTPLYQTFTEGFDIPDVREARSLLNELD